MSKAIGMIEFKTTSTGVTAADAMVKTSEVEIVEAQTVCPGKYIAIITGDLSAVKAAVDTAVTTYEDKCIDSFVLGNPHESIFPAIYGTTQVEDISALGILETYDAASIIEAADQAAKTAIVDLIELRIAKGMCGKSYMMITGEVSAVEASIDRAKELVAAKGMYLDSSVIAHPDRRMTTVFYNIRGKKFLTLTLIKNFSKKGGKDMLALERRNLILEKLQAEKRVVVSELSQLYDVSEETIRRDLDKLEKEGLAIKSYGGAVINEDVSIDLPFNVRKNQNVTGKQKMAELAASLVKDGDHIFLDASTTAVFVAKALKEKERLTVITNSMEILLELADVSGWNIISTGGVMKEGYLAFLGSKTDESIRSYYVDKVIFSCKALDLEWGIMESQEAFGSTKRAMIGSGRKKILVVDSSKFDQTAFSVAGSMKEVDIIVTDKEPTERWKKHFEKFNVKCLYPV